jgi:predicted transcriptional regulator
MMNRTGNQTLIQDLNRNIFLKTIGHYDPISRSKIARRNGLSPTTVSIAFEEYLKHGLVNEDGIGKSSGGRKPILIRFSPKSNFIIGIAISNDSIEIADINLIAEINKQKVYPSNNLIGEPFIDYFLKSINQFLEGYPDLKKYISAELNNLS